MTSKTLLASKIDWRQNFLRPNLDVKRVFVNFLMSIFALTPNIFHWRLQKKKSFFEHPWKKKWARSLSFDSLGQTSSGSCGLFRRCATAVRHCRKIIIPKGSKTELNNTKLIPNWNWNKKQRFEISSVVPAVVHTHPMNMEFLGRQPTWTQPPYSYCWSQSTIPI